mmetsp:Transcript_12812/g.38772  ORF Transcript_12812/g.38772 Transcript_12812/m.38772 type:complete len:1472 (-) Transcript_12812:149-4564(-)
MKDLRVLERRLWSLLPADVLLARTLTHSALDSEGRLFACTSDLQLFGWNLQTCEVIHECSLIISESTSQANESSDSDSEEGDLESGFLEPDDSVVDFRFVPDLEAFCIASAKGVLLVFDVESKDIECVGMLEGGITALAWSPDYELVALTTGKQRVLLLTQEWDMIAERTLDGQLPAVPPPTSEDSEEDSADEHAQDPADESACPELVQNPCLSWRGDGKYLVVCYSDPAQPGGRIFRVWSREFQVTATCDEPNGLTGPIAWQPTGELIAAPRLLPNRLEVSLFERNGLQHYFVPLRVPRSAVVQQLAWNADSDLLGVLIQLPEEATSMVQVWTRRNYHWYLKQELVTGVVSEAAPLSFRWDEEDGMVLNLLLADGNFARVAFLWHVHEILAGSSIEDEANVYVTDGCEVLCSTFSKAVVPPPLCSYRIRATLATDTSTAATAASSAAGKDSVIISVGSVVNSVGINHNSGALVFLLSDQRLVFVPPATSLSLDGLTPLFAQAPTPQHVYSLHDLPTADQRALFYSHVCVIDEQTVLLVQSGLTVSDHTTESVLCSENTLVCLRFSFPASSSSSSLGQAVLESTHVTPVEHRVLAVECDPATKTVFLSLADGRVMNYQVPCVSAEMTSQPISVIYKDGLVNYTLGDGSSFFAEPCQWISPALFGKDMEKSRVVLISRSQSNKLFVDGHLASNFCTSFTLHPNFVLFTTMKNNLHFITRDHIPRVETLSRYLTLNENKYDDSIRTLERGAELVTVSPSQIRVVLQMPRGNLEAIYPRALVVTTSKRLIAAHQYLEAFSLMRIHRVDLNLLCDLDLESFIEHVALFVDQVTSIQWLNLYISSLREENTCQTVFLDRFAISEELPTAAAGPSSSSSLPAAAAAAPPRNASTSAASSSSIRPVPSTVTSKVNRVCQALRSEFLSRSLDSFCLPVLSTLACECPPQLEAALSIIKDLKSQTEAESGSTSDVLDVDALVEKKQSWSKGGTSTMSADKALRYLMLLVDVGQLYKVALSMYDFDLAVLVAQKSQMDPKEYLPFLNKLRKLPTHFQRYSVDLHLNKLPSALENLCLSKPEDFSVIIHFIQEHDLYSHALLLYSKKPLCDDVDGCRAVCKTYADRLLRESPSEAAILYERAGDLHSALKAYQISLEWRLCLVTAEQLSLGDEEMNALHEDLVDRLADMSQFSEAFQVALYHLKSFERALQVALDGSLWNHAHEVVARAKMPEWSTSRIQPAVENAAQKAIRKLQAHNERFERYSGRLVEVKERKLNLKAEYDQLQRDWQIGIAREQAELNDSQHGGDGSGTTSIYSDASIYSFASYSSFYSTVTAGGHYRRKNKKGSRRRRPRVSGREGSEFEEEFYVNELKEMIPSRKHLDEFNELLRELIRLRLQEQADHLHALVHALIELVKKVTPLLLAPLITSSTDHVEDDPLGPDASPEEWAKAAKRADQHKFMPRHTTQSLLPGKGWTGLSLLS